MTAREHRRACKLVTRDRGLSSAARLLWHIIETYADKNGLNAYPKLDTLAADCGHKRDWVCRHRNELRAAGLLHWSTIKRPDGTNESCRYVVLYPGHDDPALSENKDMAALSENRDTTGESIIARQNGELDDLTPAAWSRAYRKRP